MPTERFRPAERSVLINSQKSDEWLCSPREIGQDWADCWIDIESIQYDETAAEVSLSVSFVKGIVEADHRGVLRRYTKTLPIYCDSLNLRGVRSFASNISCSSGEFWVTSWKASSCECLFDGTQGEIRVELDGQPVSVSRKMTEQRVVVTGNIFGESCTPAR